MEGAAVLIADDNEQNRLVLSDYMAALGHRPALAENGAAALDAMAKEPPDLLLLDILMPVLDGYGVLERMRGNPRLRDVPVLVISAADEVESVVRCIKLGAEDYLVKPFNPVLLRARVGACLAKKRLRDAERELLERTLTGAVEVLAAVLSLASPMAFGRSMRARRYVRHMAGALGLDEPWRFEVAALLSQIGYITVPEQTLAREYAGEDLPAREREMVEAAPAMARDLLARIPRLDVVAEIVARQSDPAVPPAGGAPSGWDAATVGAQMLRVALAFDQLRSRGAGSQRALEELRARPARYYPSLVEALAGFDVHQAGLEAKGVPARDLLPGMVLAADVRTVTGTLLLTEGEEVTLPAAHRIRCFAEHIGVEEPIRVLV